MNWKRTACWLWVVLPFLLLAVGPGVAVAKEDHKSASQPCRDMKSGQSCLYEATEEATFDNPVNPTERTATASLMGRVVGVFPGCDHGCDMVANASSHISLALGGSGLPLGAGACSSNPGASVCGTFAIVVNEPGTVDAAEVVVGGGVIFGTIDLSPAVAQGVPLGSITDGMWFAQGVDPTTGIPWSLSGTFTGTFRLPFTSQGVLKKLAKHHFVLPHRGVHPAFYLLNNGMRVPVRDDERSLDAPTVRLEVEFVAFP